MEPASSLPHSQQPATCPYPEPDQSSPCLAIPLLEDSACVLQIRNSSALYISCNWNPTVNKGLRMATPLWTVRLGSSKREVRTEGRGNEHISPLELPHFTISKDVFFKSKMPSPKFTQLLNNGSWRILNPQSYFPNYRVWLIKCSVLWGGK